MKMYIFSQFSYCRLAWMCCNRTLNSRINHLLEQALRLVYRDKQNTFKELVEITKIFKDKNGVSPSIMNEVFQFIENFYDNLRTGETLK